MSIRRLRCLLGRCERLLPNHLGPGILDGQRASAGSAVWAAMAQRMGTIAAAHGEHDEQHPPSCAAAQGSRTWVPRSFRRCHGSARLQTLAPSAGDKLPSSGRWRQSAAPTTVGRRRSRQRMPIRPAGRHLDRTACLRRSACVRGHHATRETRPQAAREVRCCQREPRERCS